MYYRHYIEAATEDNAIKVVDDVTMEQIVIFYLWLKSVSPT